MKHLATGIALLVLFIAAARVEAAKPAAMTAAPASSAKSASAAAAPATEPKTVKVLRFDSLAISGEASKPQVFYLLNRKKIQMRHKPEEKNLIESLEETVKGEPF